MTCRRGTRAGCRSRTAYRAPSWPGCRTGRTRGRRGSSSAARPRSRSCRCRRSAPRRRRPARPARTPRTAARPGRARRPPGRPSVRASRPSPSGTSPATCVSERRLSSGSRAARPSLASPTTGTSVAIRAPARAGSASIWATRTLPASGRCLVYGKLVPTRNRVSISSIRSSDGLVPSSPIPPVVYGESSGTVALPDSVLTIGRAQRLGHGQHLVAGVQRARAGQDRDLLPVVEEVRQPLQVLLARAARRGQPDRRGPRRAGRRHVLPRVGVGVGHLDVVGHGEVRHAAARVARSGWPRPPRRAAEPGCRSSGRTRRRPCTACPSRLPAGTRCRAPRSPACR